MNRSEASRKNAVKAGRVTSHIVKRKKQGWSHEAAKREAHELFNVKTSKYKPTNKEVIL